MRAKRPAGSLRGGALAATLLALAGAPAVVSAQQQEGQQQPDAESVERRLNRLENIVNSGQLANILQRIDTLTQEIRQLRGEIETQSHRLDELRKRQRNLYADLDRRIRELEVAGRQLESEPETADSGSATPGAGSAVDTAAEAAESTAAAAGSAAAAGGEAADTAASEPADPAAEREAYDAAFQLLREGRYQEAAAAFQTFLQEFPDGPYADNAQYWLGEARYVTRDFSPALDAFEQVIEQHPDSAKVPDARLKLGYTLYEMGRYEEARDVLQQVVKQHPESAVARLAEERLVRMKNEGH